MAHPHAPTSTDVRDTAATTSPRASDGHGGAVGRVRDRGASLVEIVVAVALLAIVVVPVLGGVAAATRASSVARASSNVETAIINAVDRINRADAAFCDYYPYARAAVVTQGWSDSEVSVVHEHLALDGTSWAAGGCPSGVYVDGLVQRVTITVRDPDRRVSRTIQVVKSDV